MLFSISPITSTLGATLPVSTGATFPTPSSTAPSGPPPLALLHFA